METTSASKTHSLSQIALGLGVAGLLPIPGIVASVAAIICGRRAIHDEGDATGQARLGMWLGIVGVLAPILFMFVYCVLLGYPFPIHRYSRDP
jgi:hypothetical protein